jgi:hypothetical protein
MLNRSKRGLKVGFHVSEALQKVLRFQRDPFSGHYEGKQVIDNLPRSRHSHRAASTTRVSSASLRMFMLPIMQ